MSTFATQLQSVEQHFEANWSATTIMYNFADKLPEQNEFIHLQVAPVINQNLSLDCDMQRTESLVRVTCYADSPLRSAQIADLVTQFMVDSDFIYMTDTATDSGSMNANLYFYSVGFNIYNY